MKSRNSGKTVLTFMLGAIMGISLFVSYSFISGAPRPATTGELSQVNATEAQQLRDAYVGKAQPMNDIFRGFTVNKDQLDAMNLLIGENSELAGFRVYMGEDAENRAKMVVYGVNQSESIDMSTTIYVTEPNTSGPCPTLCE